MITTNPPITNNFTVGLQNKNSAAERISASKDAQQRIETNKNNYLNGSGNPNAEFGLQDRNTTSERISALQTLDQRLVENHGYQAKENTKNALTNNNKIINIPPLERGSLLDIRI